MNHPERFHHVKYAAHSRDVVSSDTTATIEVEAYNDTDNDFNPKDVQIFDTRLVNMTP